jgi:type II secretory pathway pseudopilin PulG
MRRRQAFTLVEMMVSMALVLFVMVLLAQAFSAALETFRQLKAVGDLEERSRTVTTLLKRDLAADHFEGRRRLGDSNFFLAGPPREGFFRIWQGTASQQEGVDADGNPTYRVTNNYLHFTVKLRGNSRQDFHVTDISAAVQGAQALGLTFPLQNYGQPDGRYQESSGTNYTYSCQWAEVIYFMRATGELAGGKTPLYTLYRRQLLLVPNNNNPNPPYNINFPLAQAMPVALWTGTPGLIEISCQQNPTAPTNPYPVLYFNNPTDVTVPQRRYSMLQPKVNLAAMPPQVTNPNDGGLPTQPNLATIINNRSYFTIAETYSNWPAYVAADVLLTDVISFQVQIYDSTVGDFADVPLGNNPLFTTLSPLLPVPVHIFDTWSSVTDGTYDYSAWNDTNPASPLGIKYKRIPVKQSIPAIKVTLRLWDKKTQKTRQVSFVQEM